MQPIDIADRKQLFIDDRLCASRRGVELLMNTPYVCPDPVLRPDTPLEDPTTTHYGPYSSAMKVDGKVRVWYHVNRIDDRALDQAWVGYAESDDGVHFEKPELGLVEEEGSTANNIVIPSKLGGCSIWIDPNAPPEERYKNQTKVYNPDVAMQFHAHSSPDGLKWNFLRRIQLEKRGGWDTQSIVFWDPSVGRYVLYTRHWFAKRHTTAEGNENFRTVRRLESDDLIHWENQKIVMWPDEVDRSTYDVTPALDSLGPDQPYGRVPVDYYGAAVFKYPDDQGVYVMLAQANWAFFNRERTVTTVRDDLEVAREETQEVYGPSRFDARLSVSRDGIHFQRCGGRRPFLSPGPEGSFSSRTVWAMPNPVPIGDELWFYFTGANRDHDGFVDPAAEGRLSGIGRAILRLDGFVSADAGYDGGEIVTPVVRFEGNRMELNVDTGGGGSAKVEFQDAYGTPIEGYAERDGVFVCGNSVRMPVSWANGPGVGRLAGKSIRIRFILQDCKLYAFQFTKGSPADS